MDAFIKLHNFVLNQIYFNLYYLRIRGMQILWTDPSKKGFPILYQ